MIASTGFYVRGDASNIQYFDDDGSGNLRTYYLSAGTRVYTDSTAGTVTYSNGNISITSFKPDSFVGSTLDFTIQPAVNDLVPVRNQMFDVSNTNITVTMQDDAGTGTTVTSTTAAGSVSSTTTGTTTGSSTTY